MEQHWYAIKVFWKRTARMCEVLDGLGIEYYAQKLLPSYMFIHTNYKTALSLRASQFGYIYMYTKPGTTEPVAVPDKEIEIFRIVCSAADTGLDYLGDDPQKYAVGDRVRVIDGPFKGAEGYIRRIRKDRRLVVIISGVAAVAASFIPPDLLEKVS